MKSQSGVPDLLCRAIRDSIRKARARGYRSVHHAIAGAYPNIVRLIVVEGQALRNRAGYGTHLPEDPGARLTGEYGRRFSFVNFRIFIDSVLVYPSGFTREVPVDETDCTVWSNLRCQINGT